MALVQARKFEARLAAGTKPPISSAFPSLEAFLCQPKVDAAGYLSKLQAENIALWQLPTLTVEPLEARCGMPWGLAARVVAVASRFSAD